tara:strand:+ start:2475 stop:2903 length:429 start_codon:yes stop_codon:yes gene_type:complete
MVGLTMLILGLLLGACQTTEVAKEEKPTEKPTEQYCGPSPAMHKDGMHTILMKANEDISYRDLSEIDHLVFLNSYNKTPPPSDIKADRIRFYYKLGARQVFMVMSVQDCVSQAGPLGMSQAEAWLQGIVLDPSQFLDSETKI